jgi:hypothetical protein
VGLLLSIAGVDAVLSQGVTRQFLAVRAVQSLDPDLAAAAAKRVVSGDLAGVDRQRARGASGPDSCGRRYCLRQRLCSGEPSCRHRCGDHRCAGVCPGARRGYSASEEREPEARLVAVME